MGRSTITFRGTALWLAVALLVPAPPLRSADQPTGSVVGRVTALHKGMPAPAEASWKVRFTSQAGGLEPVEAPLRNGVYETPELPVGAYQVQVVDAFGQPIGAPQPVTLQAGAIRLDLRIEVFTSGGGREERSRWKVVAIVGGAVAALALVAGGGSDGAPASPSE
jgi:hypothetical protein